MSKIKVLTGLGCICAMVIFVTGCTSATGSYQSFDEASAPLYGKLAERIVAYEGPARNPVIVVHGFLGSKLVDTRTGKNIWGTFKGSDNFGSFDPNEVRAFALPMAIGKPLKDLKSSAVPYGMLEDVKVRMLGMSFNLNAYSKLIDTLKDAGYVLEGEKLPKGKHYANLFLFYYDWRRDLPENAARLHKFIQVRKKYLQKHYANYHGVKNFDVKFDIVAHSMGGLLSRYYLRYGGKDLPADGTSLPKLDWAGSKNLDKVLIVATPNCGYLDTVLELVRGLRVETGTPLIPPGIIGTFPTYYQMMPQRSTRSVVYADDIENSSVDIFNPEVWRKLKWGLADPKQDDVLKILLPKAKTRKERREIAYDHLSKCLRRAKQFIRAMQVDAIPPNNVALFLFQGDAFMTTRQASVDKKTGELKVIREEPGDGKILVTSSLDDLRVGQKKWVPYLVCPIKWNAVYRINAAHMGITASKVFSNNMTFCLLILPTEGDLKKRHKLELIYEKDLKY